MREVVSKCGLALPVIGLGTWRMGEDAGAKAAEVAAVRSALELGYRLIDSAEMYGDGGAERIVGKAVGAALRSGGLRRDGFVVVSKVYPHNAGGEDLPAACERSLRRLGLDRVDLYLLHWRGAVPLVETVQAMAELQVRGRIGAWGVSNFDRADLVELDAACAAAGAAGCAANQVYYSLTSRGVEFDLLPWQRAQGMPLMAYSPIDQGAIANDPALARVGARHGASAAQIALARLLSQPGVVAIPKAVRAEHLRANIDAAAIVLTPADIAEIDRAHPPPRRAMPLAML
ncbi:MAG: aldo/keto reductase [Burkholderiaceae bacterium]